MSSGAARKSAVPPENDEAAPRSEGSMSFSFEPTVPVEKGLSSSSQFSKRANFALKRIFTSSTEPERCFATINSASPRISLPDASSGERVYYSGR